MSFKPFQVQKCEANSRPRSLKPFWSLTGAEKEAGQAASDTRPPPPSLWRETARQAGVMGTCCPHQEPRPRSAAGPARSGTCWQTLRHLSREQFPSFISFVSPATTRQRVHDGCDITQPPNEFYFISQLSDLQKYLSACALLAFFIIFYYVKMVPKWKRWTVCWEKSLMPTPVPTPPVLSLSP